MKERATYQPTSRGQAPSMALVCVWSTMAIMAAISITVANNPTWVTDWVWACALVMPLVVSCRNRVLGRRLELMHVRAYPVEAGEEGDIRVVVRSSHGGPIETVVSCEGRNNEGHSTADGAVFVVTIPAQQRGVYPIPPVRVGCATPLWIFVSYRVYQPHGVRVVYPKPEAQAPGWPEPSVSTTRGGSEVSFLREHRQDDNVRSIAWKASARRGMLVTRVCDEPHTPALEWSMTDVAGMDVEAGLSRLCAWAQRADGMGRAYGVTLGRARIPPGQGPGHLHAFLVALAGVDRPKADA